jgi:hypothetical protein
MDITSPIPKNARGRFYHLGCAPGELAPYILTCGDPDRARRIARRLRVTEMEVLNAVEFIKTQLKWHFRQNRNLMPANCSSELFYDSMGICKPDNICNFKGIKNPIKYPFKLMKKNKNT